MSITYVYSQIHCSAGIPETYRIHTVEFFIHNTLQSAKWKFGAIADTQKPRLWQSADDFFMLAPHSIDTVPFWYTCPPIGMFRKTGQSSKISEM